MDRNPKTDEHSDHKDPSAASVAPVSALPPSSPTSVPVTYASRLLLSQIRPPPPCLLARNLRIQAGKLRRGRLPPPTLCSGKFPLMMSGGAQSEGSRQSASPVKPAISSCRRNKSENTSFVSDLRDHIQEFIHASADEHKTCFTKTIKKMFGMSKVVAERSSEASEDGTESVLPLQTTVSR